MKIFEAIGAILTFVSFLWVLGSVGACECENITLAQCFVQSLLGLAGLYLGIGMTKHAEKE